MEIISGKIIPDEFEFVSCKVYEKKKEVVFKYRINFQKGKPMDFTETLVFPSSFSTKQIPKSILNEVLNGAHLMLGISYFKLYPSQKIKLNAALDKNQADFWHTVYKKGLNEFLYRNHLSPLIIPRFPYVRGANKKSLRFPRKNRILLGVGGGKDSIAVCELLKGAKEKVSAFFLETGPSSSVAEAVIKRMKIPKIKVRRFLDKKIFESHRESYNGHIPISGIFAWIGTLTALFYNYSYVAVGNEWSSNSINLRHRGESINHQWSKTSEFEEIFQRYIKRVTPDIVYFSAVRHLREIRIAEIFARYKKYFSVFSSCNLAFRIKKERPKERWCGKCPKCVFTFAILSAFLSQKELLKIFGKNLYESGALLSLFKKIAGLSGAKPFDCVGEVEEIRAALWMARKKYGKTPIVKTLLSCIKDGEKCIKETQKAQDAKTMPAKFKFLGLKKALLAGYGKEGQITNQYLKQKYPQIQIGIADRNKGKHYLEKQTEYDIAVRTPGLSKEKIIIPYTTATNIFFSELKNRNIIIGVTGSKGKSTTASLIYKILKKGGKPTRLIGNIGRPMLAEIFGPISRKTIFVIELSSYQLDDIDYSPDVAVITRLFPEHMDYHGGALPYYIAKKNIIARQDKNNFFVYNAKNSRLVKWAKNAEAKTICSVSRIPLKDEEIPLLGEHNRDNIKSAIATARIFAIPDKVIKEALKEFCPLPHRLQFVGRFRGIEFYDDAISTAPESTIEAINALKKVKTIFLGGEDRGYDFTQLESVLKKYDIENIVLFPESGQRILRQRKNFNILETKSMKKAVRFAYRYTAKDKICLLSTASPSYNLWKNFEEKGDEFQKEVKSQNKGKSYE